MFNINNTEPELIEGGIFTDNRGSIAYVNDFLFEGVCRFYMISHPETDTIRAWQGHRIERKYFYVVKGAFVVAWVKIDNWKTPSLDLEAKSAVLSTRKSQILSIPAGYANGIKALESNSMVIIFSDMPVEESVAEKIRYNPEQYKWFNWNNLALQ